MKTNLLIAVLMLIASAFTYSEESDTLWCKYTYPTVIYAVKFSPDGTKLASGGSDGVVNIWNALTGEFIKKYSNEGKVTSLDISPDGTLIAIANNVMGGPVRIYNLQTDSLLTTLEGTAVKFSNDGNYIITNMIRVYNAHSWEKISSINEAYGGAESIDISLDNQYIADASLYGPNNYDSSGFVNLYKFQSNNLEFIKSLALKKYVSYSSVCYSPDGQYLAAASNDGTAKIWSITDKQIYKTFPHKSKVYSVAFDPTSKYLVEGGGSINYLTNIWEINTGILKYTYNLNYFASQGDWTLTISINKDGKLIATGGNGIYVLNAKWEPSSIPENKIIISNDTVYPNPTNNMATIKFTLLNPCQATIKIYDNNSKEITALYSDFLDVGQHFFTWNTSEISNGLYFCKIKINNATSTIKIIVNK
jgi:WD40 repeat protein